MSHKEEFLEEDLYEFEVNDNEIFFINYIILLNIILILIGFDHNMES